MNVRKLHHALGKVFAPFFIVAGLTAIPLFWRKDGLYSDKVKEILVALHTWEIGAKYIGTIMALVLITLSVTGLILASKNKEKTPETEELDGQGPDSTAE